MTPDRRLFALEYASMTLEKATEGAAEPEMSREYFLEKFNYLALPGSAIGKKSQRPELDFIVIKLSEKLPVISKLRDVRKTSDDLNFD
jgi:hypothetical protein